MSSCDRSSARADERYEPSQAYAGMSAAYTATPTKAPAPIVALPAPKTATVIPADFKITKLPPGPVPRETKRSGPSMECRCPGCPTKSRGPRYDVFCADHYAAFNAEERRKYAEIWKAHRSTAEL